MSLIVSDITPQVGVRLNDASQLVYTNAVQLPFVKDAWEELKLELNLSGALVSKEVTSTTLNFLIGQTSFSAANILPADLLEPYDVFERLKGSSDLFLPLKRVSWEPNILPTDSLHFYDWRKQDIKTIGALTDREVKIRYQMALIDITSVGDSLNVNYCKLFMINKTASLVARFIANMPTRAKELKDDAQVCLDKLSMINAKSKQGTRTRRKPYRTRKAGNNFS